KCSTPTFTMAGNAVSSPLSGTWSFVGAFGTAVITSPTSNTTTVTTVPENTNITLRWTVKNGVCTDATDDLVISNEQQPTSAAGPDITKCSTPTFTMAGNAVSSPLSGTWSFVGSFGTAVITAPTSNVTTITTVPENQTITLRWTVKNGVCSDATDDMTIRNDQQPTSAAGPDITKCSTPTFTMAGNAVSSPLSGTWSFVGASGTAVI